MRARILRIGKMPVWEVQAFLRSQPLFYWGGTDMIDAAIIGGGVTVAYRARELSRLNWTFAFEKASDVAEGTSKPTAVSSAGEVTPSRAH